MSLSPSVRKSPDLSLKYSADDIGAILYYAWWEGDAPYNLCVVK